MVGLGPSVRDAPNTALFVFDGGFVGTVCSRVNGGGFSTSPTSPSVTTIVDVVGFVRCTPMWMDEDVVSVAVVDDSGKAVSGVFLPPL